MKTSRDFKKGQKVIGISESDKDFGIMTIKKIHADGNLEMRGLETWFQPHEVKKK